MPLEAGPSHRDEAIHAKIQSLKGPNAQAYSFAQAHICTSLLCWAPLSTASPGLRHSAEQRNYAEIEPVVLWVHS